MPPPTETSVAALRETLLAGVADLATLARAADWLAIDARDAAGDDDDEELTRTLAIRSGDLVGGRYRVVRQISKGGMGIVYLARDEPAGDAVALKVIRPDHRAPSDVTRFRHEYYLMAKLSHPRLVAVRDYVLTDAGAPCLVMDYVRGSDLDEILPLSWQDAARVLYQVCSALAFLHSRGYIHHDIKPANVRVQRTEGGIEARLVDFGIMEPIGSARERGFAGTPAYLPPEALFGAPTDCRLDLYALGVLAYHMLAGSVPFSMAAPHTLLVEKQVQPPNVKAALGTIPPAFAELIADLMAPDPQQRPYDASVTMRRLRHATALELRSDAEERAPAYLRPSRLVGRDDALRRISGAWDTSTVVPQVVLVSGAAGYGKTALLREVRLRTRLAGGWTEIAVAEPLRGAYGVLRELLVPLLAITQGQSAAVLCREAPVLVRVLPELRTRFADIPNAPQHADPIENRQQLFDAVRRYLGALLIEHRLALFVDDADAADAASLQGLRALLADGELSGLMVVVAFKPEHRNEALHWLADEGAHHVDLQPFAEHETTELLASLFGPLEPHPRLAAALTNAGQGNPSFLIEILRRMADDRLIEYRDERWHLPRDLDQTPLPLTLEQAVADRLRTLDETARRMLDIISVGSELDVELLTELLGVSEQKLADCIDRLIAADAIEGSDRGYRLAPAVRRAELHSRLSSEERSSLELAVGEALERRYSGDRERHAAVLAEHFRRGGHAQKAREYLAIACAELYAAHAHTDAVQPLRHLEEALIAAGAEVAPPGSHFAELLLWTRECLARVGVTVDTELGIRYFELERRTYLPDVQLVSSGPAVLRLGKVLGGEVWRNRRSFSRLRETPKRLTRYFTATSYASVLYSLSGRFEEALNTAESLTPFIVRPRSQANAAYNVCRSLAFMHQGRVAEAESALMTAFDLMADDGLRAGVSDTDYDSAMGGMYTAISLLYSGRGRPEAAIWLERFRGFVERQDARLRFLMPNFFLAEIAYHLHRGEVEAVAGIEKRYKAHHARVGRYNANVDAQILVGLARAAVTGRNLAAAEALGHSLVVGPRDLSRGWAACVYGELWSVQRLYERARASLREALEYATRPRERCYKLELRVLNVQAELELHLDNVDDARALAGRALELARNPSCRSEYEEAFALRALARLETVAGREQASTRYAQRLDHLASDLHNPLFESLAADARQPPSRSSRRP